MSYLLVLLLVSFAFSGLGWIYFIYFFSIGYGFSVSALAVTIALLFRNVLTPMTAILCAVMFNVHFWITSGTLSVDARKEITRVQEDCIWAGCS